MILKLGPLRKEILKLTLSIICISIPLLIIDAWIIVKESIQSFLMFVFIFHLPIFLIALLLSLSQLEWYLVYSDRIEVKGIFSIKNTVYFEKVLFVERTEIPLTNRGMHTPFFIFNDGRKNNGNILDSNSCYNRKKYNLRIYITPELEEYITKTLHIRIQHS